MYVTLNHIFKKQNTYAFVHTKPVTFYIKWYKKSFRTISSLTNPKLAKIPRRSLVKLL